MCPVRYYDILKDSGNPFNVRMQMVDHAREHGISVTAKAFKTTRDTVRKWVHRYKERGTRGLHNLSRAPKHIPHKTPAKLEKEILFHRKMRPSWGPIRLKEDFGIRVSTGAIYRILKQNDCIEKYYKKHRRQKDLREMKLRMKAFEKIQIDVKDLNDIPHYYRYMKLYHLPRYQFTARDVKSGLLYIAHGRRHDCVNAANFLTLLAEHLKEHGVDLRKVIIQTDNGSEFIGNWRRESKSIFSYMVEKVFHMRHDRIPPGRSTYNSDVESSHLRIEKDFYDLEEFPSTKVLQVNSLMYLLYFNLLRRNKAKKNMTSYELVRENYPLMKPTIATFNPIILEDVGFYYTKYLPKASQIQTDDHVPEYVMGGDFFAGKMSSR